MMSNKKSPHPPSREPDSLPTKDQEQASRTIEWLNGRFGGDISQSEMRYIMEFALIWNCFERDCFGCHANLNKFTRSNIVSVKSCMDCSNYETLAGRFIARMKTVCAKDSGDPISHYLGKLCAESSTHPAITYALTEPKESRKVEELALGLLLIARRVRNNLFHGEKHMESLPHQSELFKNVNDLLMQFMDDFKASGAKPF